MDVQFKGDNYNFNVRSSCIIKDKKHSKVLLTNMRAVEGAFILPGGRVELLESTRDAVVRELNEELGLSENLSYSLISIQENFNKEPGFHMLEFVYYTEVESFDFLSNVDQSWDKFLVFDIENIDDIDIRPKTIKKLIKKSDYIFLNQGINYDWGLEKK